jgi:hypothetical protein
MEKLITHNSTALRFLMTEDLYVFDAPVSQAGNPVADVKTEPVPEVKKEEQQKLSFDYLGENNRYFLILVDDPSQPVLNTPHKEMLMKIMAAKKLELRDLSIVNLAKYPGATFDDLKNFFTCSKLALFGVAPQRIGLPPLSANTPEKHLETRVLATFGLEEMSSNTDKKREFWNVMKDF